MVRTAPSAGNDTLQIGLASPNTLSAVWPETDEATCLGEGGKSTNLVFGHETVARWQGIADICAAACGASACLILCGDGTDARILVRSAGAGDPFRVGEQIVANDLASYRESSIHWPQGEVFGKVCVLGSGSDSFSQTHTHLIDRSRAVLEQDLARERSSKRSTSCDLGNQDKQTISTLPNVVHQSRMSTCPPRSFSYISTHVRTQFQLPEDPYLACIQLAALIHPLDRSRVAAAWAKADQTTGYRLQYRLLNNTGGLCWVEDRAEQVRIGDEVFLQALLTDITAAKLVEEGMRNGELLSANGSWTRACDEDFLTFSQGMCELLRLVLHDCRCSLTDLPRIFHDGTGQRLKCSIEQGAKDGQPFETEVIIQTASGEKRVFRALGKSASDKDGLRVGQHGTLQEISRERSAQLWLEAHHETLELAMHVGAVAEWELTLPSGSLHPGLLMTRLYGQRTTAREWLRSVHREDRSQFLRQLRLVLHGGSLLNHQHRILVNGEERSVRTSAQAFRARDVTPFRVIGTTVDVTQEHDTAASLRTAEKLAAMARMASVVSHEINNPLQCVTNLLHIAKGAAKDSELYPLLQEAEAELGRAVDHVSRSLRFHYQSAGPEETCPRWLMDTALSVFRSGLTASNVDLRVSYATVRKLHCYRSDLEHALKHLISNSLEAIGKSVRPQLSIRVRNAAYRGCRDGVSLMIADNGCGIDAAVKSRLFEPFVTSKGDRATGLGLWVAQGAFARHKAKLQVRSWQGRRSTGTILYAVLPCRIPEG